MLHTGIDLIEIERIARAVERWGDRFLDRVFTPSEAEIAFAERVAGAFAKAEAEGSAAIQLDGRFIDYPIVYRAQRLLEKIAVIRARERRI